MPARAQNSSAMSKTRVAYYYKEDVGRACSSRQAPRFLQRRRRPSLTPLLSTPLALPNPRPPGLPPGAHADHYYGPGHPMKPFRMKLAHHLILSYGLYRKMECYRQHTASAEEMAAFHSDDYVDFLRRVTPEGIKSFQGQMQKCA